MVNFLTPSRNEKTEVGLLVNKSKKRLESLFKEEFEYHHLAVHRSNAFLRRHSDKKIEMFVLFVDLGKSTIMSSDLTQEDFAKIIRMFSQEMAYVIEHYGGLVLKFVGDAVIGYFPSDGKSNKTATKVACCAYAMNHVISDSVNPLLEKEMLYRQLPQRLRACFKRIRINSNKWPYHEIHTTKIYPVFLAKI